MEWRLESRYAGASVTRTPVICRIGELVRSSFECAHVSSLAQTRQLNSSQNFQIGANAAIELISRETRSWVSASCAPRVIWKCAAPNSAETACRRATGSDWYRCVWSPEPAAGAGLRRLGEFQEAGQAEKQEEIQAPDRQDGAVQFPHARISAGLQAGKRLSTDVFANRFSYQYSHYCVLSYIPGCEFCEHARRSGEGVQGAA